MPFTLNYTNLLSTVSSYLERDDLTESIPIFIMLAETKVARVLKNQLAQIAVTNNLILDSPLVVKPARWVDTISFTIQTPTGVVVLKERTRENIQAMFPDTTATSIPKYYSEFQQNYWYIGATPDDGYAFEIMMYQQPEALSETQQTNYLTETAPDLLLYSTLLEATAFLKNDSRLAVWTAARDQILSDLGLLDQHRQSDRQQDSKKGA